MLLNFSNNLLRLAVGKPPISVIRIFSIESASVSICWEKHFDTEFSDKSKQHSRLKLPWGKAELFDCFMRVSRETHQVATCGAKKEKRSRKNVALPCIEKQKSGTYLGTDFINVHLTRKKPNIQI